MNLAGGHGMHPFIDAASRLGWLGAHVAVVMFAVRSAMPASAAPRPVDPPPPPVCVSAELPPPASPPVRERSAAPILARNPFDSTTGPLTGASASRCGSEQLHAAREVVRSSDDEVRITRAFVDRVLEQQAEMMHHTRVIPEIQDERVVGVRLVGVRPGTLLADLGFQNGDRLETINAYPIASPEQALEAYARLRAADYLVVKVRRRGVLTALHIVIC